VYIATGHFLNGTNIKIVKNNMVYKYNENYNLNKFIIEGKMGLSILVNHSVYYSRIHNLLFGTV